MLCKYSIHKAESHGWHFIFNEPEIGNKSSDLVSEVPHHYMIHKLI